MPTPDAKDTEGVTNTEHFAPPPEEDPALDVWPTLKRIATLIGERNLRKKYRISDLLEAQEASGKDFTDEEAVSQLLSLYLTQQEQRSFRELLDDEKLQDGDVDLDIGDDYIPLMVLGHGGNGHALRYKQILQDAEGYKEEHRAVKFANDVKDKTSRGRFGREADRMKEAREGKDKVDSVVEIVDYKIEKTRGILILQFVPGYNLQELISGEGPLPFELAMKICALVARELALLHKRGIVHQDIKPANIMLEEVFDAEGTLIGFKVTLLDFTTSKRSEGETQMHTQERDPNAINGTIPYADPAYLRDPGAVRTKEELESIDTYQFGTLCFHLTNGRIPNKKTAVMPTIKLRRGLTEVDEVEQFRFAEARTPKQRRRQIQAAEYLTKRTLNPDPYKKSVIDSNKGNGLATPVQPKEGERLTKGRDTMEEVALTVHRLADMEDQVPNESFLEQETSGRPALVLRAGIQPPAPNPKDPLHKSVFATAQQAMQSLKAGTPEPAKEDGELPAEPASISATNGLANTAAIDTPANTSAAASATAATEVVPAESQQPRPWYRRPVPVLSAIGATVAAATLSVVGWMRLAGNDDDNIPSRPTGDPKNNPGLVQNPPVIPNKDKEKPPEKLESSLNVTFTKDGDIDRFKLNIPGLNLDLDGQKMLYAKDSDGKGGAWRSKIKPRDVVNLRQYIGSPVSNVVPTLRPFTLYSDGNAHLLKFLDRTGYIFFESNGTPVPIPYPYGSEQNVLKNNKEFRKFLRSFGHLTVVRQPKELFPENSDFEGPINSYIEELAEKAKSVQGANPHVVQGDQ